MRLKTMKGARITNPLHLVQLMMGTKLAVFCEKVKIEALLDAATRKVLRNRELRNVVTSCQESAFGNGARKKGVRSKKVGDYIRMTTPARAHPNACHAHARHRYTREAKTFSVLPQLPENQADTPCATLTRAHVEAPYFADCQSVGDINPRGIPTRARVIPQVGDTFSSTNYTVSSCPGQIYGNAHNPRQSYVSHLLG